MNNRNWLPHLLQQHKNGDERDKLIRQLIRNYGQLSMTGFTRLGWLIFFFKSLRDLQAYKQGSYEHHK